MVIDPVNEATPHILAAFVDVTVLKKYLRLSIESSAGPFVFFCLRQHDLFVGMTTAEALWALIRYDEQT